MSELRKLGVIASVSLISNTRPGDQLVLSMGVLALALLAQVGAEMGADSQMGELQLKPRSGQL